MRTSIPGIKTGRYGLFFSLLLLITSCRNKPKNEPLTPELESAFKSKIGKTSAVPDLLQNSNK
jgi:hypothetical protein